MKDLEILTGNIHSEGEEIYWELVRDAEMGANDQRPVIVLSHGAGGSHAVWYQQIPELGQRYRIVTWDSRGFGNSTNETGILSPHSAANDLASVLDQLEIDRAHLVGQSMGGWHISAFATLHRERTSSLIYCNTVGGLWTPELRSAYEAFRGTGGLKGNREIPLVGGHVALWTGHTNHDMAHAFLYQALGSFHSPPLDQLGKILAFEITHDELNALNIPVLVITAEHDQIFPASLLRDSAGLASAQFTEISDAGHSPYFEQPAAFNKAILKFLSATQ